MNDALRFADAQLPKVKIMLDSGARARLVVVDGRPFVVRDAAVKWSANNPLIGVTFTIDAHSVETQIDPNLDTLS